MKLYEIDNEINDLLNSAEIDPETGEIIDISEQLALLQKEKEVKIQNYGLWLKNINAEKQAIITEINNLTKRMKSLENKENWHKKNLARYVGTGKKFSFSNLKIGWRNSKSVEIAEDADPEKLYKEYPTLIEEKTTYSFRKRLIRMAIEQGENIDFAYIQENNNIQIK